MTITHLFSSVFYSIMLVLKSIDADSIVMIIGAAIFLFAAAWDAKKWKADFDFYKKNDWDYTKDSGYQKSFGFGYRSKPLEPCERLKWGYLLSASSFLIVSLIFIFYFSKKYLF